MIDHYSTLGVGKNANADDIKKAYRKLAGKHHPDKGGNTATFQKIEEAYRILSDPNQRQQYDNPMPQGNPFGGFPGAPGGFNFNFNNDMNDLFGQMFQQHNRRQTNTPHAFRTQVNITLEQAYHGDSQNLQLQTPHGNHAITIEIPKGVTHGAQIRYENVIPQATLIVEFIIQHHLKFERRGNDLYCTEAVSVLDLIVGTDIEFTTFSGKKLMVTVPPRTQPHMHLKISKEGMPIQSTSIYGDQIILIKPIIPDTIDSEITDSIIRAKSK
jgi:DnaJ-class molecular chaperone